jgi:hypothetical protein
MADMRNWLDQLHSMVLLCPELGKRQLISEIGEKSSSNGDSQTHTGSLDLHLADTFCAGKTFTNRMGG